VARGDADNSSVKPIVWQDPAGEHASGLEARSAPPDAGIASQSPLEPEEVRSGGTRTRFRPLANAPMDLLSYLRILRRRWLLIAVTAVVGVALGAGTALANSSSGSTGSYSKATNLLFLDTTANTSSGGTSQSSSSFTNLQQDALLVTSGDVPNRVGTKLGGNGRQLANQVITLANTGTDTLAVTAIGRKPGDAEQLANTFATELISSITDKQQASYNAQRDKLTKRISNLQSQISGLDAQAAASPGNTAIPAERNGVVGDLQLAYTGFQQLADQGVPTPPLSSIESAQAVPISATEYNNRLSQGQQGENVQTVDPNNPSNTPAIATSGSTTFQGPLSRGVLGGFLGLIAGIGLALVAERLDRRLRSRPEVEEAYGVPVLAEVPVLSKAQQDHDEVVSYTSPLSRTAEAHRAVRSALRFQHLGEGAPGTGGNGKRGATPAEAGVVWPERPTGEEPLVVLVGSAMPNEGKTTTTANLAAVFAESGASVLAMNCDFRRPMLHRYLGAPDEPRKVLKTTVPGVTLVSGALTDAAANPAQVIASQREVVAAAREHFDVVLLDTAPLITTNDAFEIMPGVDAVVLVARPDVTTSDAAERARELLERIHAPVVGVVLVAEESAPADTYYYYSSTRVSHDVAQHDKASTSAPEPHEDDIFPDEPTDEHSEVSPSPSSS
jgi:Mrp family chromosome partitioning ATPase/capsular polysaccharide biosynthesis protein